MDENQLVEEALETLREIAREYPNDEVGLLAGAMQLHVRQVVFNMHWRSVEDQEEIRRRMIEAMHRSPTEFVDAAAKAIAKKRGPTYKTPVFKCLEDFEKCKKHHSDSKICLALMCICVGKHLMPFVKHPK